MLMFEYLSKIRINNMYDKIFICMKNLKNEFEIWEMHQINMCTYEQIQELKWILLVVTSHKIFITAENAMWNLNLKL